MNILHLKFHSNYRKRSKVYRVSEFLCCRMICRVLSLFSRVLSLFGEGCVSHSSQASQPTPPFPSGLPLNGVRSSRGQHREGSRGAVLQPPFPQPLWPPHGLKWWGGGAYCHLQARATAPQLDTVPPLLLHSS